MKPRFFASILGLSLALSAPFTAQAQSLDPMTCRNAFDALRGMARGVEITADSVSAIAGWCRITNLRVDTRGQYQPNYRAAQVEIQGDAVRLLLDPAAQPRELRLRSKQVNMVMASDFAPLRYALDKQALRNGFSFDLNLQWDAAGKLLTLQSFLIDFGNDNTLGATAAVRNVDLSSPETRERSLTGFAVTNLDLKIETNGLFEAYLLTPLALSLLPADGSEQDMEAAVTRRKQEGGAVIGQLPDASVSRDSKAALTAVINALPNPTGEFTLSMRSDEGFGPVRFASFALRGTPKTVAEAAPLLNGVVLDFGWKPAE